ncbi:hypothetical protein P171DRAFT_53205 [Karstenula rhodostoma CBS 690.94]|uniref:Uncharacterized protein n=1 Tax=Karstenula rhodostoma CBS 690.94 TaxID=1392251 RepID=A0A9P4PGW6_9PLEO|nr:hypothetical protein P171DRAFT_53205 [Karstenula rhodostoma CBS 690.94]
MKLHTMCNIASCSNGMEGDLKCPLWGRVHTCAKRLKPDPSQPRNGRLKRFGVRADFRPDGMTQHPQRRARPSVHPEQRTNSESTGTKGRQGTEWGSLRPEHGVTVKLRSAAATYANLRER